MKNAELIALALAGVAVYIIVKKPGALTGVRDNVTEILNAAGGAWDNGWRYFSDGTAVSPQGEYFFQGASQGRDPSWTPRRVGML